MIYVENTSNYPQRVYIPRDDGGAGSDIRGYQFQKKDYDIDQNGETYIFPDPGYDGITAGTITVHVPTDTQEAYDLGFSDGYASGYTDGYSSGMTDGYSSGYTNGYASGYTDGYSSGVTDGYSSGFTDGYASGYTEGQLAQKEKLEPLTANTNGHYSREDGYSDVYVDVQTGGDYSSGYTDGMAAQKALLTSTTFTQNGHYSREDGWNEVDVRLNLQSLTTAITENGRVVYLPPEGAQGFDTVEIDVQVPQTGGSATLTALTATTNGDYTPEQGTDGWSAVTVNVDTASTYNSGYTEGYSAGTEDTKAQFTAITATTNGLYTSNTGYSAVTVNVPSTGETYSRSHIIVNVNTDDMEGLIGTVFTMDDFNSQTISAFTITTTADTVFTAATLNPGIDFHLYGYPPIGYTGEFEVWDHSRWNEDSSYDANFYRYDTGSTTVVTARTYSQGSSVFPSDDMRGLAFAGSSSAITGPTTATYDSGEDKWYLEYPGTLVEGFYFKENSALKQDIIGIELPSTITKIKGFDYALKLEYVYGDNIVEIGNCDPSAGPNDVSGFEGCTALTTFAPSQGSVRKVGRAAFQDCNNLSQIFNIYQLRYIGRDAFLNCWSLSGSIELYVSTVPYQAFCGCTGLTDLYITQDVTDIETYAFANTSINYIYSLANPAPALSSVGNPFMNMPSNGTLCHYGSVDYSAWFAKLPGNWNDCQLGGN